MRIANTLAMGYRLLSAKLLERRVPLNLMLAVTNRCPSLCNYCQIPLRQQREMTTDEMNDLLTQFAQAGGVRVGIWGGEPLMRPDIGRIVEHATGLGLYCSMDTNGYLVPKRMDVVKKLSHMVIALDGPEAMHDANREAGAYRKAIAGLEAAAGHVSLWTITVLTRNNLQGIDHVLSLADKYGFLCTFQILHHNHKLGANHPGLLPGNDEYRQAIHKLIKLKMDGAPIASSLRYLHYLAAWGDYSRPQIARAERLRCYAGRFYVNVDVDGSVYPCSLMIDEIPAPNFLEIGFKKAFLAAEYTTCASCAASCYVEYNHMYDLDPSTIWDWLRGLRKTEKARRSAAKARGIA